jgi:hypothetical protein
VQRTWLRGEVIHDDGAFPRSLRGHPLLRGRS